MEKIKGLTKSVNKGIVTALVATLVPLVIVAGAGVALGITLSGIFSYETVNYEELTIDDYEPDHEALMKKYKETSPDKYFQTFTPDELVNIALDKVGEHQYVHSVAIGEVTAVMNVKQSIRSYLVKNNNNYFFENISHSTFVSVQKRFYQDETKVDQYNGDYIDAEHAKWKDKVVESLDLKAFEEKWGRNYSRTSIFIISNKTTLEGSKVTPDGDNYVVSLNLDPTTAVLRYVKQMVATSNLADPPKFNSMQVDFTIDKDLNLLKTYTTENYDVKSFGLTSKGTKAHLAETFYYDEVMELPDLQTDCSYQ